MLSVDIYERETPSISIGFNVAGSPN